MKPVFLSWIRCLAFVIIVPVIIEAAILKMCRQNASSTTSATTGASHQLLTAEAPWFHWAQFQAFCIKYEAIYVLIEKNGTIDGNCEREPCQQCQLACSYSSKNDCKQNCESDACKNGCEFYFEKATDMFRPNISKAPFFTDDVIDVRDHQLEKTLSWQALRHGTIYLVTMTIEGNSSEIVVAMGPDNSYNLNTKDSCSITNGMPKFKLTVYAINEHGLQREHAIHIQNEIRIPTIKDINVEAPVFYTYKDGSHALDYGISIISDFNLTNTEIFYIVSCPHLGYVPNSYLPFGHIARPYQGLKQNETRSFKYTWIRGDAFSGCDIKFEAKSNFHCYVTTQFKKSYTYKGCRTVKNMPKEFCPNTTEVTTTVKPASRKIDMKRSSLMCVRYTAGSCIDQSKQKKGEKCQQCTEGYYHVNVSWFPQNEPFDYYTIEYGNQLSLRFGNLLRTNLSVIVPKNETSYTFYNISAGRHFAVMIYKNGKFPQPIQPQPTALQLPALWKPINNSVDKLSSDVPTKTDSSSNRSEIILASILPVAFMFVVLAIYLICKRKKKLQRPAKEVLSVSSLGLEVVREEKIETDDWEITPTSLTLEDKIGEGAFGTVFSALLDPSHFSNSKYAKRIGGSSYFGFEKNPKVAVKLLKDGATSGEWTDFKEEINLMKDIGYHKNIVNMIGCSTVRQPLCLVVEFMQNGDLLHYLRKRRSKLVSSECLGGQLSPCQVFMYTKNIEATLQMNQAIENSTNSATTNSVYSAGSEDSGFFDPEDILTPDDLLTFAWQIASGMEFLSLNNMVHRDLAARNILVGQNKLVKISDFGLTRKVGTELVYMSTKNQKLPIKWMSVEAIFDQIFTTYSDVWAYGVVLFEIVTLGGTPYPTINNRELLSLLSSGYRMEKPQNCADTMYEIMKYCWQEDPLQRPTFTQLREHLEEIMNQGSRYLSFDIDEKNIYYNVASFKSIPSEDEDDIDIEEQILDRPAHIKAIDELKKERQIIKNNNTTNLMSTNSTATIDQDMIITIDDEDDGENNTGVGNFPDGNDSINGIDSPYANKYFHDKRLQGQLHNNTSNSGTYDNLKINNGHSNGVKNRASDERYTHTRLFANASLDLQQKYNKKLIQTVSA